MDVDGARFVLTAAGGVSLVVATYPFLSKSAKRVWYVATAVLLAPAAIRLLRLVVPFLPELYGFSPPQ